MKINYFNVTIIRYQFFWNIGVLEYWISIPLRYFSSFCTTPLLRSENALKEKFLNKYYLKVRFIFLFIFVRRFRHINL